MPRVPRNQSNDTPLLVWVLPASTACAARRAPVSIGFASAKPYDAVSVFFLSLILAAGLTTSGVSAQAPARPLVEAEIETAPVELDGAVLFRVRGTTS